MTWLAEWADRAIGHAGRLAFLLILIPGVSACASGAPRSRTNHGPTPESLASYIDRVRVVSQAARPRPSLGVQSVETWDPGLASALLQLAAAPTAAHHRQVASEYRRLGILDVAHAHFTAAVRLDDRDAAAFDGLARIWRDWGFPHLGLDDSHRAVELAPASASAANTLGTLLQAQGNVGDAARWYERAAALDPDASYAVNNLCYASVILRRASSLATCQRAVDLAPQSRDARNNLALAFAAGGNFERARVELGRSGDAAVAHYNTGILYLADRQYSKAVAAFNAALQLNPRYERALVRVNQARIGAGSEE